MRKLKKYDCYVWTEFFEGTLYLQSAPIHKNGMIDPEKSCDVSVSAFTEKELAEYTREVGRVFEEAPSVVLRWIRGEYMDSGLHDKTQMRLSIDAMNPRYTGPIIINRYRCNLIYQYIAELEELLGTEDRMTDKERLII